MTEFCLVTDSVMNDFKTVQLFFHKEDFICFLHTKWRINNDNKRKKEEDNILLRKLQQQSSSLCNINPSPSY